MKLAQHKTTIVAITRNPLTRFLFLVSPESPSPIPNLLTALARLLLMLFLVCLINDLSCSFGSIRGKTSNNLDISTGC